MTILALVLAVDALTAAFLLGLVHCRDVTPPLPRRVPGAALRDNPAPAETLSTRGRYTIPGLDGTWLLMGLGTTGMGANGEARLDMRREDDLPYVAPSQTIGDRARARGDFDWRTYYTDRYLRDTPTQVLPAVKL